MVVASFNGNSLCVRLLRRYVIHTVFYVDLFVSVGSTSHSHSLPSRLTIHTVACGSDHISPVVWHFSPQCFESVWETSAPWVESEVGSSRRKRRRWRAICRGSYPPQSYVLTLSVEVLTKDLMRFPYTYIGADTSQQ